MNTKSLLAMAALTVAFAWPLAPSSHAAGGEGCMPGHGLCQPSGAPYFFGGSANGLSGSSSAMANPTASAAPPVIALRSAYPLNASGAKQYIEELGYADVQNLTRDSDGWYGTATRNGRLVSIDLDESGLTRSQ